MAGAMLWRSTPTMRERITVSVVICAYADDRWNDLLAAIESVRAQDVAPEIVVVIDHNQALAARVRAAVPDLRVVENSCVPGLSGARNAGIAAASGEIIAFLDDDAVADPRWLGTLLCAYRDPAVVGVGGAVLPLWLTHRPSWFPPEFDWVVGCTYRGLPDHTARVRNPIGANMSFRAEVFRDVGTFHPEVGRVQANAVGCEETELCIRIHQQWPERHILYHPAAIVRHRVPAARCTVRYFLARCCAEGRSKALVAGLVGAGNGLSVERVYTRRVLPRGFARGIGAGLGGDPGGVGRAAAIAVGFAVTAWSYLRARRSVATVAPETFGPVRVLEIELSRPLPSVSSQPDEGGTRYARALALVRVHGDVLGTVSLPLTGGTLLPEQVAMQIQAELGERIAAHLRHDGLPLAPVLGASGITSPREPTCRRERDVLLADPPSVSIVIPTRDRTERLAECLRTVRALCYPTFEVIVVDNGPTSAATSELMRELAATDIRLRYVSETAPGLSHAKNRGVHEARGEIVAFTDDDVLVDQLWLANLVRNFQISPRIACVTGLIFPRELETVEQTWIEQFGGFGKGFERRLFDLDEHRPPGALFPYTAGAFGSGANLAFRTAVLRELGGFDPALGSGSRAFGGEDLAVMYRAIVHGYGLAYEPAAVVHHLHHRTYEHLRRQVYGYGVGLTAYVAHTIAQDPASSARLLRKLPVGIAYALNPWSGKNRRKVDYPRELTFIELGGMLYGPLAYWRSRRDLGKRSA